jgi:hypothetical protein
LATTGLTAQQERTAAPATHDGTSAVNAEGTSNALARADHRHALLYTAAGGVARTFASKHGDVPCIRDFGAKGDGVTDDGPAFVAAFAALTAGQTLYVPDGNYCVPYTRSDGAVPTVPAGLRIVGDGYNSVIKLMPTNVTTDGAYRVWLVDDKVEIANLRFDGNKAAVNTGPLTSLSVTLLYPYLAQQWTNFTLDHCWFHDVPGIRLGGTGPEESFAVLSKGGNVRYLFCKGWNFNGTPFSVDGSINLTSSAGVNHWYDSPAKLSSGLVLGCEAWGNTWQGFTFYGVDTVRVIGCRSYGNAQNGFNFEWTRNVDVLGCQASGNTFSGFGGWGAANVRLRSCAASSNGDGLALHGQIMFRQGAWFESDGVNPAPSSVAETIEMHNCTIDGTPAGSPHVTLEQNATVNVGTGIPQRLLLNSAGAESWIVTDKVGTTTNPKIPPCVRYAGMSPIADVGAGDPTKFKTAGAGISIGAYGGAGALGSAPATFTSTTQFNNVLSRPCMEPGKTYRVRVRGKREDTNSPWSVTVQQDGTSSGSIGIAEYTIAPAGTWLESEACITIPATGGLNWQIQIIRSAATGPTSQFSLDYAQVELLSVAGQAPAALPIFSGKGTAAPTTGYHMAGELWLNTAPTVSDANNLGWVCVTAGTPGTWREFAHVSADTDNPSFGSSTGTAGTLGLNGPAGSLRILILKTAGVDRWYLRAGNQAETGANAGSDFEVVARDDTGALIAVALNVVRATGVVNLGRGLSLQGGATIKKHLSGTKTWDPASIAPGQYDFTTVTVTGAALTSSDTALAGFSNAVPAGCFLLASVTAADTVTVTLLNLTTAAVDLASGTLRCDVWQH